MRSSGPERPAWKVSWKPLRPSSVWVTSALTSDSVSAVGAGTGTVGPISSVRWMPSSTVVTSSRLRERDAQAPLRSGGQVERAHRVVGVGDPPERLGRPERAGGQHIQPLALGDVDLGKQWE